MTRSTTNLTGASQQLTAIVWAVPVVLIAATAFLYVFGEGLILIGLVAPSIAISIPFSIVGALIVSRQPRQVMGWVMWVIGGSSAVARFLESYGQVRFHGVVLAESETARALAERSWIPAVALLVTLLPLLFPTGRLLSPRWRWIGWLAVAAMLVMIIPSGIFLWIHRQEFVNNPHMPLQPVIDTTFLIGAIGVLIAAIASIISVIVRVRRSSGIERQQMKWFLVGATSTFAGTIALFFAPWKTDLNAIAFIILPVTIGVAILHYDLYDIDHVINRTLVYSTLTAILAGADLILVIGIEHLFRPITSDSDLVIAGSTLVVAACIQPLRSRIQTTVDRRFYRHKYDAARTLEAFSARLRDEIDLDMLLTELSQIVQETMQPEHVSLWLSQGDAR
jgi:hypothetical protein